MTNLDAILLGLIQGLTEFLPVSSSGHLVVVSNLLNVNTGGIIFEVMVHVGTVVAVSVFMREEIIAALTGLLRLVRAIVSRSGAVDIIRSDPGTRLGLLVAVGSVPTGLMGVLLSSLSDRLFTSTLPAGLGLIVTGLVLRLGQRYDNGEKDVLEVSLVDALVVGVVQGLAIVPGVSRSGSTVAASLMRGMSRDTAAKLSFLMSIPVILGATMVEFVDYVHDSAAIVTSSQLVLGTLVAAASGFVAVGVFMRLIRRGKLAIFSWYCFALGVAVLAMR